MSTYGLLGQRPILPHSFYNNLQDRPIWWIIRYICNSFNVYSDGTRDTAEFNYSVRFIGPSPAVSWRIHFSHQSANMNPPYVQYFSLWFVAGITLWSINKTSHHPCHLLVLLPIRDSSYHSTHSRPGLILYFPVFSPITVNYKRVSDIFSHNKRMKRDNSVHCCKNLRWFDNFTPFLVNSSILGFMLSLPLYFGEFLR